MEKGRTNCPNCKKEIIFDIPDKLKKFETVCPFCNNRFFVQAKTDDIKTKDDFLWIEHGEPRKTILSYRKTKTNRPKIAGILLVCVFIIGLTASIFSENFIVSSLNIVSSIGLTGSIKLKITDLSNNSIENASVKINGLHGYSNEDGIFSIEYIKLGIHKIEISAEGYENKSFKKLVTPFLSFETVARLKQGEGSEEKVEYNSIACTMILLFLLVFTVFAAFFCFERRNFDIAIFGSFISIFTVGFFFLGSIISIIAFVLVYMSMDEFRNGEKGKVF